MKPISIVLAVIFVVLINSCCKKDDKCDNLIMAEVRPSTQIPTDTLPCDFTLYINTTSYYAVNLPDSLKIWDGVDYYKILVTYHKLNELYYCNSGNAALQFEKIELDCIDTF